MPYTKEQAESVKEDIKKQVSELKETVKNKDIEIRKLLKRIEELESKQERKESSSSSSQVFNDRFTNSKDYILESKEKLAFDNLLKENQMKIVSLEASIQAYQDLHKETEKELKEAKSRVQSLSKDLQNLNKQTQGSFKPEEISSYLSKAIDGFNSSVNNFGSGVNYIINGMDIEMKTLLGQKDGSMIFSMPSISSEDSSSLSVVKFSIKPIPKE